MLCDTGPLVALLDKEDPYHERARQAMAAAPADRFETTWPCMGVAMYMLGRLGGQRSQDYLLQYVEAKTLSIQSLAEEFIPRIRMLMRKYDDHPMDFADASLVVVAEITGNRQILTFDQHFRAYLIHDQFPFEVIP